MKTIGLFIALVLLGGCAIKPPASISRIPADNLTMAEVLGNPVQFVGSEVRWGGTITRVENKASQTWIEVVSRVLEADGRPAKEGWSDGRFIASLPGFADPAVYKMGYLLTVVGAIEQTVNRPIGEYDYTFPVIAVTGSYLWKVEPEKILPVYPPPWRYYDFWPYPYYPFPYRPRYF